MPGGTDCNCSCDEVGAQAAALDFARPGWPEFVDVHVLWPVVAQLLITPVLLILSYVYEKLYHRKGRFQWFIHAFVGTAERPQVTYPAFVVTFELLQLVCSSGCVLIWIWRTRTLNVTTGRDFEFYSASIFVAHYGIRALQAGFQAMRAWCLVGFIDIITVIPVVWPRLRDFSMAREENLWLSLSFLRSIFLLRAYQRVQQTVDLYAEVSEFYQQLLSSFFRTVALVLCMGGTIYILEILSEIPGLEEPTVDTAMGSLSFVQMSYWVFTTVSTVGYGDFAPRTVPSRICTVCFIVGGVVFFSNEINTWAQLKDSLSSGKGKYRRHNPGDMHIVIVSSNLGTATANAMMVDFLDECLDVSIDNDVPNVVLLSETPYDQALESFTRTLPPRVRNSVFLLVGTVMSEKDLERVQLRDCYLGFIIPDVTTKDAHIEDSQNTLRALEMRRYHPGLGVRLMLLEPESHVRALNMGFKKECCFSAKMMKAQLFAQACRVKGFMTLLVGLVTDTFDLDPEELEKGVELADKEWMHEYVHGLRYSFYAFVIHPSFEYKCFRDVTLDIFERSNGTVLLVAAQFLGNVVVNFDGVMEKEQVVIAIAPNERSFRPFEDQGDDWRSLFQRKASVRRLKERCESEASFEVQRVSYVGSRQTSTLSCLPPQPPSTLDRNTSETFKIHLYRRNPLLIVLILVGELKESSWWQVLAFMRSLRQNSHVSCPPTIIFASVEPPQSVVASLEAEDAAVLVGPMLSIPNLTEAGVLDAHTLVVLRCEHCAEGSLSPGASSALRDHNVVLLVSIIEQMLETSDRDALPFTIFEFVSPQSICLTEHAFWEVRRSSTAHRSLCRRGLKEFSREGSTLFHIRKETSDLFAWAWRVVTGVTRILTTLFTHGFAGDDEVIGHKALLQRRFAAGQAFAPNIFGMMLGRGFHFPGILELVKTLTAPELDAKNGFVWQVGCPPEWVGCCFGDLLRSWLLERDAALGDCGTVLILALYRQLGGRSFDDARIASGKSSLASRAPQLLRTSSAWSQAHAEGFNVTMPAEGTVLRRTDLLTVIGGCGFGEAMRGRGLLHGSAPASRDEKQVQACPATLSPCGGECDDEETLVSSASPAAAELPGYLASPASRDDTQEPPADVPLAQEEAPEIARATSLE